MQTRSANQSSTPSRRSARPAPSGEPASRARPSDPDAELCGARIVHAARVQRARTQSTEPGKLNALAAIFKALGDPTRLKIVVALAQGEMCVCDLAAFLRISESAVSHQLRKLRDLRVVANRRDGQVLYYLLDDDHVATLLDVGLRHIDDPRGGE